MGGQELSMSGLGPNISSPCGLQKESVCVCVGGDFVGDEMEGEALSGS